MQPRVFWDAVDGWVIETAFALSAQQVAAAVAWARRIQTQRLVGKRGDAREQAERAISALSPQTIKQRVVAKPGAERVLFSRD